MQRSHWHYAGILLVWRWRAVSPAFYNRAHDHMVTAHGLMKLRSALSPNHASSSPYRTPANYICCLISTAGCEYSCWPSIHIECLLCTAVVALYCTLHVVPPCISNCFSLWNNYIVYVQRWSHLAVFDTHKTNCTAMVANHCISGHIVKCIVLCFAEKPTGWALTWQWLQIWLHPSVDCRMRMQPATGLAWKWMEKMRMPYKCVYVMYRLHPRHTLSLPSDEPYSTTRSLVIGI